MTTGTLPRWGDGVTEPSQLPGDCEVTIDPELFDSGLRESMTEFFARVLRREPSERFDYADAHRELQRRFPIEEINFEALFLETLRATAEKARVDWNLVLRTDARPGSGDWQKLLMLVGRAAGQVEQHIRHRDRTVLLTYANLLGRYDQMGMIERLRDNLGRDDGPPGLWLLIAGDNQPTMDGKPVPILSPAQRAKVPASWVRNEHRGSRKSGQQEVRGS